MDQARMKFANYRVLMLQSGKILRCCYTPGESSEGGG